ncbi:ABC transporter ATP-binding protein [Lactiplantibacillus plantarum]|nr:ABC transporter ATP-binding protein [Lactiplantibacillus plantarum]
MVNTILKEADLFCPKIRIKFAIYHTIKSVSELKNNCKHLLKRIR